MDQDFFDISAETKKKINAKYTKYYEQAKDASDNGKLKLVSEKIVQPYDGYGFKLDKGQVLRYELISGAQIIDTLYLARDRPKDEWADVWNTSQFSAMMLYEGMHYYSNTPFVRPLLTIIKDTVDYKKLENVYGKAACHSFVYNTGRCSAGIWEVAADIVNANSCDSNMIKGIYEIAGEEIARSIKTPHPFMHFQICDFAKLPTTSTFHPNLRFGDIFKKGDYVELLAHQDLYGSVSTCPSGDQNDYGDYKKHKCYPIRVAIYEGADGPLETAPDPQMKSLDAVDWVKAGRPGMVIGEIGEPQS